MPKKKVKVQKQAPEKVVIDYREVGATGLRRYSGFIYEEFLRELIHWEAVKVYKEMGDNDATVGAILYTIDKMCRRVPWRVEPASKHPNDQEAAEFLESCMNDMETTWIDMISEILSFLQYGYSVHELVYKRRCGAGFDPTMRSKYTDGRIGWRAMPIRSQDTIYRWQFDDHGGIQGVEQLAPPHYYHVTIPVEKFLLFRTTVHKNNPEGRSILRSAYRAWYNKKNIENIEAIGIERDLAGLPVMEVPEELLSPNASPAQKALAAALKEILVNIRRDEQEGAMIPSTSDPVTGKPLYNLKLLSTGGSRQFDTSKIIDRYDTRISMTMLADFILLGHQNVGSLAMHKDKSQLFAYSIGAFLDIVAEVMNRFAIPRLFGLNDFAVTDFPKIVHGDVANVDLEELTKAILNLTNAGMPIFPNEKVENHILGIMKFPKIDEQNDKDADQIVENPLPPEKKDVAEIPGNPYQMPTGLDQTSDTTPVNQKPPVAVVTTNETGNSERMSQRPLKGLSQYTKWGEW